MSLQPCILSESQFYFKKIIDKQTNKQKTTHTHTHTKETAEETGEIGEEGNGQEKHVKTNPAE